jgi:hypothetical protein
MKNFDKDKIDFAHDEFAITEILDVDFDQDDNYFLDNQFFVSSSSDEIYIF